MSKDVTNFLLLSNTEVEPTCVLHNRPFWPSCIIYHHAVSLKTDKTNKKETSCLCAYYAMLVQKALAVIYC